ncbi:glycosyl transferase family protein [Brucella gallinifaecis]|uniref:glycosyl transferase family protein n=1 Tax=Brucella gallinifaecis TaxID=215590 RepID=UPI001F214E12|nr:glycosyl transferase family protein [Brucella gallinifaecis]
MIKKHPTQTDIHEKDSSEPETQRLGQLRLLIALDALLVEGSVGGAAIQMGLSTAAMSRLLGQIRKKFDDPILVRSGRGMVATPKAESLRGRLRRLANEADSLMKVDEDDAEETPSDKHEGWVHSSTVSPAPLAIRKIVDLANHPTPEQLAVQLADIWSDNSPARRLAKYIAIIGRKVGHTRPLDLRETEDAFTTIFAGKADPMQISALLRLIHYRGETAPELAGMVLAARHFYASDCPIGDHALDWPAYLSPNSTQSPWFMLAARLVACAGYPVVLHGRCGDGELAGKLEMAAKALNIPIALSHDMAKEALRNHGICFMPVASFAPQVNALLSLYHLFESRSSINSLVHLLNPLSLKASFLGVSQPAYRELHRDTGAILGMKSLSIVSTSRDVAELLPQYKHTIYRYINGQPSDLVLPTLSKENGEKHSSLSSFEYWYGVWTGSAIDKRAENTVIATAAMAMMTATSAKNDSYATFHHKAEELWHQRHKMKS